MEIFGILFSIPVAFIATSLYCLILYKFVRKSELAQQIFRMASYLVLTLFGIEVVLLILFGVVRSRGLLGPGFFIVHLICFFLGPPAVVNVLFLKPINKISSRWYVACTLATIFAFLLVLLQYSVSEALYGIDGEGGPYSQLAVHRDLK
jgi:hypothetical protein